MASSNPFSQLSTNFLDVSSAYKYYERLCDDRTRRDVALTTSAIALFIIYGLGIVSQAVVLPANLRLSEQRSAFLLLLYINVTALLPDAAFYDAVQIAEVVSICMPLFFYAITVFKMVLNFKQHHSPSTGKNFFHFIYQKLQVAIVLPIGSQTPQEDRAKFVNLMQERTRLFSMCLLSQVPYYMSHALYQSSRIFQLNEDTVQVILAIFWQLLGTIFHVQQPMLMLLLSRDLRSSVRKDLANFWNWLKEII
ncbi:hypothetical protein GPALN_010446 [Globodera pallida]|nr:hypothetical protein GPALN_010446 [Globodera pallida]